MKKILILLILLGGAAYGIISYHFILFDKSFKILKKSTPGYENSFVDARGMKKMELLAKPDLIEAGIKDLVLQMDAAGQ